MASDQHSWEETIRVVVADNTHIHTQLLAEALRRDRGLEVIGCPSNCRDLVAAVAAQKVGVAVISSNLEEEPLRGLEVLRELRASRPETRAVILLDSSKREVVVEAFRAGARGVFSRHDSLETLCQCVRHVHEGQIWANGQQMAFAVEALAASPSVRAVSANGLSLLSKREMDVVRCLAEGLTNREIAERLGLSQHTIKNYLFRVFDKLGVSSRLELLFLTLTQPAVNPPSSALGLVAAAKGTANGSHHDSPFAVCQAAAEQGLPAAQAALARMYWQGAGVAKDVVAAYMWYLIAERSSFELRDEISSAKGKLASGLTPEQIVDAQTKASSRLKAASKPASPALVSAMSSTLLNG
jgi:two-component system nitrate/nitrite response regulator NarL